MSGCLLDVIQLHGLLPKSTNQIAELDDGPSSGMPGRRRLPHFMELRNVGDPMAQREGEGNSEAAGSARRIASREAKRAGITRP
jgi:hypothetical protein